jgi:hypothetical protein
VTTAELPPETPLGSHPEYMGIRVEPVRVHENRRLEMEPERGSFPLRLQERAPLGGEVLRLHMPQRRPGRLSSYGVYSTRETERSPINRFQRRGQGAAFMYHRIANR